MTEPAQQKLENSYQSPENDNQEAEATPNQEQGNPSQKSSSPPPTKDPTFSPHDISQNPPVFSLRDSQWTSMLIAPCSFEPEYFQRVMLSLIHHPDIASTYLFRAEILYDSFNDPTGTFLQHMKADFRPLSRDVPGYLLQQTIVRRFVPRNPQRDDALVQTCHIYKNDDNSRDAKEEKNLVIYFPHATSASEIPFYHPTVHALAFLHTWSPSIVLSNTDPTPRPPGTVSIHYSLFPTHPLTPRLTRTALALLTLINKHSLGQKAGYQKRVHHDRIVPQARFQDTYTRLKAKYAKKLIERWVEQTPPGKHVFEDLGIASFMIEVWGDMYGPSAVDDEVEDGEKREVKTRFPGFVDIGCGNGVLVYVLLEEGYEGWGFDARRRKTWETFPQHVQDKLEERVLVPEVLRGGLELRGSAQNREVPSQSIHNGIFPASTFIISNHADELTPWTPLLASLSRSPFIAIPCCSHNFTGAKFRAPVQRRNNNVDSAHSSSNESATQGKGDKTGSLKKHKQPSAYATLCDWVSRIAEDVGFAPEKEMLRIPSTRNVGIVGRKWKDVDSGKEGGDEAADLDERMNAVRRVLVSELGGNVDGEGVLESVGREWCERAEKLVKGQGGGH